MIAGIIHHCRKTVAQYAQFPSPPQSFVQRMRDSTRVVGTSKAKQTDSHTATGREAITAMESQIDSVE